MKSIIHLNYSLELDETTITIDSNPPLFIKAYVQEKAPKKSLLLKTKNALIKLQPSHWFDGVWDDLSVKL